MNLEKLKKRTTSILLNLFWINLAKFFDTPEVIEAIKVITLSLTGYWAFKAIVVIGILLLIIFVCQKVQAYFNSNNELKEEIKLLREELKKNKSA